MTKSNKLLLKLGTLLLALVLPIAHLAGESKSPPAAGQKRRTVRAREFARSMKERLPEVARVNQLASSQLHRLCEHQSELWVDDQALLLFVCEGLVLEAGTVLEGTVEATTAAGSAIANSSDAFQLHSLPGASRVIYLDFTGHTTSKTQWNNRTSGADIVSAPFDMDGNPNSWSSAELDRIKRIWQRVAEDYLPFAVDVTTQDPGVEALRKTTPSDNEFGVRVVISPTSSWYSGAGGVAYVGSFQWNSDTPAFVFSDNLGPNDEKALAEASSHEAGHTLGLSHDGTTNGGAYYMGHGSWAPIMGGSYYRPITQWSRGEYANANNQEDDIARIPMYGLPAMADDHGNDTGSASAWSGTNVNMVGNIETRSDVDMFRFTTGTGTVSFSANGTAPEMNLDVQLELLDANGNAIASSDPAGTSALISASVGAGTYYLRVQGVGAGDPATSGYSDYGSVGEYYISGSLVATSINVSPVPSLSANPVSGTSPLTVSFSGAGSSDADGSIASHHWNFGDGASATGASSSHVYNTPGSYNAVLTVTDNSGATASSSATITVLAPAVTTPVGSIDGGFEAVKSGASGAYDFVYNPSYPGMTFSGSSGVSGNGSGFTAGNPGAPAGTQVAFVQMQGSISFQAEFAAGNYQVNALVANRSNYGGTQTVNVHVDGTFVGSLNGGSTYTAANTSAFPVSAGMHTISLNGQSTSDATLFIDQLSISNVSSAVSSAVASWGFEVPALVANTWGAYQYRPGTTGTQPWTFTGSCGVAANGSGFTELNPPAPAGTQVAFLQTNDSVMKQTLNLPSSGSYGISVKAAKRGNYNNGQQIVQVLLDGAVVGSITPNNTDYRTFSVNFSAAQGSRVLTFRGTVSSDCTVLLDDVKLVRN